MIEFSPVEFLILKRLCRNNKEISDELGITVPSVKAHIHSVIKKLGAENRTRALALCLLDDVIKINEVVL